MLNPADDEPAIFLENCDIKDAKSFDALQWIALKNRKKRCSGSWEDIVTLNNATLPPAVYDRLKKLAQKALDGCNVDVNFVDPGYDTSFFRSVYPNITVTGRIGLIILERTHIYYLVSFISSSTLTVMAVTALIVYLTYQGMKYRVIMAEVEVTQILHSAYGYFRAHGENPYLAVERIDRLRYDHEFRSLKLHSYAKFIPWMSNAQGLEDAQKQSFGARDHLPRGVLWHVRHAEDGFTPDGKKLNFFAAWGVAQVVTVGSGILSYPWDTVRHRMMMQSGRKDIQEHVGLRRRNRQERGHVSHVQGCAVERVPRYFGARHLRGNPEVPMNFPLLYCL